MLKIYLKTMVKNLIIFDLDGTLADVNHRRKFLEQSKPDWDAFYAHMADDVPNENIVALYKSLWKQDQYEVLIVTGRHERFRALTMNWFKKYDIPYSKILMRGDKDFRPDHEVKQDMLNLLLADGKKILFTVDDRQQVVDMWRRNGITCLQCDYGDF